MKRIFLSFLICCFGIINLYSQEFTFSMEVSGDTVLLGNYIELVYTVENANGEFEAPPFEGFQIVSGPNYSSSISIANGEMKSKQTYSYFLAPYDVGVFSIDPAFFIVDGKAYESQALEIIALPNPEGIKTHPQKKSFMDTFRLDPSEQQKKLQKKKRKLKKI